MRRTTNRRPIMITESKLRKIIKSVIIENIELSKWNDTQDEISRAAAQKFLRNDSYEYPEDFYKIKARMPSNYVLIDPDSPDMSGEDKASLMAYGKHVDAFIPMGAFDESVATDFYGDEIVDKRFAIIKSMSGHKYFKVEI